MARPNILYIMTDQQRFDTIASLGNTLIHTPNLDRLAKRGIAYTRAYSSCPVCVPARYTIRTGCESPRTGFFTNRPADGGDEKSVEAKCGPYLARRMGELGYRTFGIGKFHTHPKYEDIGYEVHLRSEEISLTREDRMKDDYSNWIDSEHPAYAFIEQLNGERTDMYYMPQTSSLPAALNTEAWSADQAIEQIEKEDERPYFGLVSFMGPHPPFAPPIPFNRMYNPDTMPNPVLGDIEVDHMDEQIPWMNRTIWADGINDSLARSLKARYYAEISFIDYCLGKILDCVERQDDADNTLICFFSDHGEHLGDHHAWQKESFFEASTRIPFLLSWPEALPANQRSEDLVSLADLFGIATRAAGSVETRDGADPLGTLLGEAEPRQTLFGIHGQPGTRRFKIMAREGDWKYIYMANGGMEQLFDVRNDPNELVLQNEKRPEIAKQLREKAIAYIGENRIEEALDGDALKAFPKEALPRKRIFQFDLGVKEFGFEPKELSDALHAKSPIDSAGESGT